MYEYKKTVEIDETAQSMKIDKETCIKAIVVIQRAWRRYAARKDFKRKINRLEELLDMTIPSWKPQDISNRDEENFQRRLEMIPIYAKQAEKITQDESIRVRFMIIILREYDHEEYDYYS